MDFSLIVSAYATMSIEERDVKNLSLVWWLQMVKNARIMQQYKEIIKLTCVNVFVLRILEVKIARLLCHVKKQI